VDEQTDLDPRQKGAPADADLNAERLCSHGNTRGRRLVLDILEAGLATCDPYLNTRRLPQAGGRRLIVGHPDFEPPGGPAARRSDL